MSNRFLRATEKGSPTRYGWPSQRVQPGAIIALTHEETLRFKRGYDRQIREGAFEEVAEKDHKAWLDKRATAGRKVPQEAKADEAKAKAAEEAKADKKSKRGEA